MNNRNINIEQELSTMGMTWRDNIHAGYFSYMENHKGKIC